MSKNIVFEGWLTKSPPTKRIWRTKWRRRWFALRQSGELPGQYFLDYYADRNCRRLKGTINLDLCEQVDAGLHMERTGNGTLDPKLRGSVFTIQTQQRTYHLEADCEADMEKWVDAICRVCGLRATDDATTVVDNRQHNVTEMRVVNNQYGGDSTGPYIPISECITGVRGGTKAFTFDSRNIVMNTRTPLERVSDNRNHQMYMSQPHIRVNNAELSENESTVSDEDCKSLTASQSNIRDWHVAKTFTKLSINPNRNGLSGFAVPPVPPPRPPKTFHKESYQGPKLQEPVEVHEANVVVHQPRPTPSPLAPASPRVIRTRHDEDDFSTVHQPRPTPSPLAPASPRVVRTRHDENDFSTHQYCNLSIFPAYGLRAVHALPPAVDRALKPRHYSIGHINHLLGQAGYHFSPHDEMRSDVLQYLDLDLHSSDSSLSKTQDEPAKPKKDIIIHGKSLSAVDTESVYKTVDFIKTEAFNITRQDAEASRNIRH